MDLWENTLTRCGAGSRAAAGPLPHRVGLVPKKPRVFLAVAQNNWEQEGLVESWHGLADTVHFDWSDRFNQYSSNWFYSDRALMGAALVKRVAEEHAHDPFDLFFSYLSGRLVRSESILAIRQLGIRTVNFAFDDVSQFWGRRVNGVWTGNAELATAFDLNLTVADPRDVGKYQRRNAKALFLPPAGNPSRYFVPIRPDEKTINISFVGQRYGTRDTFINALRAAGIHPAVHGRGWDSGELSFEQKIETYRQSLITLGFGFVGRSRSVSLKGRDFEIPLTGACYITSWNPVLAQFFRPDEEIVMFRSQAELVRKVKHLLNNPNEAIRIATQGQQRAMNDHTWQQRWKQLLLHLDLSCDHGKDVQ